MNFVTCTKNERLHLWVPETGLVTKVDTGFQHITHCDVSHFDTPYFILGWASMFPSFQPLSFISKAKAPRKLCRNMCGFSMSVTKQVHYAHCCVRIGARFIPRMALNHNYFSLNIRANSLHYVIFQ